MLWRRVEALCVFVMLMYLLLRVLEWNSYVLLGAYPHHVLDPLSINVRKLRGLLDRRGILFGGVFEKAELAALVRHSGGVTMVETEDAERLGVKGNSSLLPESINQEENVVVFTGADHFNEQVEDCKDSIWIVQVVAANGRMPVISTAWRQLIAKLEPFGVRFGIYNCRDDMSVPSCCIFISVIVMSVIMRKPILRQASMTPSAAREGMKVLEKYCRKKYRNSSVLNELDEYDQFTPEPLSAPIRPKGSDGTFRFPDEEAEEELQPTPTPAARRWKYLKAIYQRLGINHLLLLTILLSYSLLGGLMFLHIERPHEEQMLLAAQNEAVRRQTDFARRLQRITAERECSSKSSKTGDCLEVFKEILIDYDRVTGLDARTKLPVWKWDYWTAVFYALTLITTIGFGNMHCKTAEGRVLTILYTIVGLPLMLAVLKSLGTVLFNSAEAAWNRMRSSVRRRVRRQLRRFSKKEKEDRDGDASTGKGSTQQADDDADEKAANDSSASLPFEETFPLPLALAVVFLYIGLCAAIFRFWESDWDYFTAFYFVFISLSTVGLGDEMPAHPHYACGFFLFFLVGLALVSMCAALMQMRYEARYMAALQLIDEEAQEAGGVLSVMPQETVLTLAPSLAVFGDSTPTPTTTMPTVRWRSTGLDVRPQTPSSDLDSPRTPLFTRHQSSFSPSAGSSSAAPPAVLGVLMSRRSTLRRTKRSSSGLSGSVSADERGGSTDQLSQPQISPPATGNAVESFRPMRASVVGGPPLSVIDEATDEDKAHRLTANRSDNAPSPSAAPANLYPRSTTTRSSAVTTPLAVITESKADDRRAARSSHPLLRRESSIDVAEEEATSGETAGDNTSSTNSAS
uniref:Potassium channel domain-containing protein n=2 Tax=Plectus sambesii TaxID=2011161 RepID=A0A914VTZ5_9BILA